MPLCAMRLPLLVTAALLAGALVACGTTVTKEQADFVCSALSAGAVLGTGGVAYTHGELQTRYGLSAPDAAAVMRKAVDDYCPEFKRLM